MANITVEKAGNSINVDFGKYHTIANIQKSSYDVSDVKLIQLTADNTHVQVYVQVENTVWFLTFDQTYTGSEYFIVDSIGGVAPTSNEHLYNLITQLR